MAIDTILIGNYANDGTGDDLRTAFQKVNANFAFLDAEAAINNAQNLGGVGLFAQASAANLQFKGLTSTDTSVTITPTSTTVNLAARTRLNTDPNPTLAADLNLNGYVVKATNGGDIQSTVYNFSVPNIQYLLALLLESNTLAMDMGTFPEPTGYETNPNGYPLDMNGTLTDGGGFTVTPPVNQINFGDFITGSSPDIPSVIEGGGASSF